MARALPGSELQVLPSAFLNDVVIYFLRHKSSVRLQLCTFLMRLSCGRSFLLYAHIWYLRFGWRAILNESFSTLIELLLGTTRKNTFAACLYGSLNTNNEHHKLLPWRLELTVLYWNACRIHLGHLVRWIPWYSNISLCVCSLDSTRHDKQMPWATGQITTHPSQGSSYF